MTAAHFSLTIPKIVFRASRPKPMPKLKNTKIISAQNLVAPTNMEIYTINADGTDLKQLHILAKPIEHLILLQMTRKSIFSSNHHSTRGYDFQLYTIDLDGKNLKQITYASEFNAFPMFSKDGKNWFYN